MQTRRVALAALTATFVLAGAAQAQDAALGQIPGPYGAPVTLEQANRLVAAALAEARRRNFQMAFAVVDPSGELVAFGRMDTVQTASIATAQNKARSAARFRRPTLYWQQALAAGSVNLTTIDGVVAAEGGVPIVDAQGHVTGAIGVSGGTSAQDGQIAAAALAAH